MGFAAANTEVRALRVAWAKQEEMATVTREDQKDELLLRCPARLSAVPGCRLW